MDSPAVAEVYKEKECLWGREKMYAYMISIPFEDVAVLNPGYGSMILTFFYIVFDVFMSTPWCTFQQYHTYAYTCFFNGLASAKIQDSVVPQQPKKRRHRTMFHYVPKANWMNGKQGMLCALESSFLSHRILCMVFCLQGVMWILLIPANDFYNSFTALLQIKKGGN